MKMQPLPFFNFSCLNKGDETVDIYVDGYIVDAPTQEILRAYWGDETSVSYKSIRDQVLAAKPKTVNVYINSGGGQVVDAMAIHDFFIDLENKGTTINRYGRGIIASAATYLLMGKNSEISENSWFMIHNVSGGAWGDVNDIENAAKLMRKFNNQVRDLYAQYTGESADTIEKWMNEETWFTGKEAVDKKFVDKHSGEAEFKNAINPEQWLFNNTTVLNSYNSYTKNNQNYPDMDMKKIGQMITDAVKAAFNTGDKKITEMKPEELQNMVTKAITDSVNGIADEINNTISTAINAALADKGAINAAIAQAITDSLAENGGIATAIANSLKDYVTAEEVNKIKKDIGNKLSGPGKKNKSGDDDEDDKKDPFNHKGISWNNNETEDDDDEDEDE
jgi:ATP-dependent protease ClpP protease subunit